MTCEKIFLPKSCRGHWLEYLKPLHLHNRYLDEKFMNMANKWDFCAPVIEPKLVEVFLQWTHNDDFIKVGVQG